ncbi:hypothetical protein [Brevundimonas sp. SORGH_AS_0993]|uniref:hypothetical protein n=1 Tax=Brevundimonas sp. SORGH_AS_0993 TaxID=3041794 RepID=UPI002789518C|nr:hypothetical protein [Brevundimonas sp. SORGH_AS_0993]MDQ1153814.1 hypothetical protein [Brevundimonas sp. SORGH_AS_0993]
MLDRVPAVGRDVPAAAKGDPVVDDDDFLMMAGADGTGRIQPELHHPLAEPPLRLVRIEALRGRDQQGRFPDQQPHVQIRLAFDQHPQLPSDLGLPVARPRLGVQMGARIELPAQDDDRPFRLLDRRGQGVEIGLVLHQYGESIRHGGAPQARARSQQAAFVRSAVRHSVLLAASRSSGWRTNTRSMRAPSGQSS